MSGAPPGTTLVGLLLAQAESQPDAPCYVDATRSLTYGELARNAGTAAAWLAGRGISPGDTIALSLAEEPAADPVGALELFYGAAWLGVLILPLYPDVPEERRAQLVARYGARRVEASDYPRGGSGSPPPRGDAPDEPFMLQPTSGTTGEPKMLRLTHEQYAQRSLFMTTAFDMTRGDRLLAGRRWPALVGMRHAVRIQCVGGTYCNLPFPRTRRVLAKVIADHGLTLIHAAPAQVHLLLREPGERVELRGLYIGGSAMPARAVRQAREQLCRNVYVTYGMTETHTVAMLRPEDPADDDGRVGRLLAGVQCESVDGELRFRAPWMPQGYFENPQATAARFKDGWFHPGDLGAIDAQGYVHLRGRTDDVINHAGVKINPQEIEAVLLEHPEVADAALVGITTRTGGQAPIAFIVARRPGALQELEAFCRGRIDASRLPVAFAGVKEIPRNAGGKIDRAQLRRMDLDQILGRKRS